MTKLPVLFTQINSEYKNFAQADCYDINRNFLSFTFDKPCIAHPPCRSWSRLRGLSKAGIVEKSYALYVAEFINNRGDILVHPNGSSLFKKYSGLFNRGFFRKYSMHQFSHPAHKLTLVYFNGIEPGSLVPEYFNFNPVTHSIGSP
jgi:hypothetical protein